MSKSAIICVDDERIVLESLKIELEREFGINNIVELAENGEHAIEIYLELEKLGYEIPVVISDYIMPGINGDELLKKFHSLNNRTFKILLTGQADVQGIANAVNNSSLFKVIFKPWNNKELLFIVKDAIKHFYKNELISKQFFELKKNDEILELHKQSFTKFKNITDDYDKLFNDVLPSIIKLNTIFEKGYFLNHTNFVITLSLRIADELNMELDNRISIVVVCLLYHYIMQNMPEMFIGVDPNEFEIKERKLFFDSFNFEIDNLSANGYLNKYSLLLSQIWEHFDGSGLPCRLTSSSLSKITQIINLAIIYHNGVYKFPDESMEELAMNGEINQTPSITAQRHASIMKFIIKNSAWYDTEIIEVFKRLIKSKIAKEILSTNDLIKVCTYGNDYKIIKYSVDEFSFNQDKKILVPVEKIMKDMRKEEEEHTVSKRSLEAKLKLEELRAGMIANSDVITKYGRVIVSMNSVLTPDNINEIMQVKKHGLFNEEMVLPVLIPREV